LLFLKTTVAKTVFKELKLLLGIKKTIDRG